VSLNVSNYSDYQSITFQKGEISFTLWKRPETVQEINILTLDVGKVCKIFQAISISVHFRRF
jgi:hypothetical protein